MEKWVGYIFIACLFLLLAVITDFNLYIIITYSLICLYVSLDSYY